MCKEPLVMKYSVTAIHYEVLFTKLFLFYFNSGNFQYGGVYDSFVSQYYP